MTTETGKKEFKTLSSITKSDGYEYLRQYIDIADWILEKKGKKEIDEVFSKIIEIVKDENIENCIKIYYFRLLSYFYDISTHNQAFFVTIMRKIKGQYEELTQPFIQYLQSKSKTNHSIYFIDPPKKGSFYLGNLGKRLSIIYKNDTIEYILQNDNINELKTRLSSSNEKVSKVDFFRHTNLYEALFNRSKSISILNFCAIYGSVECFKFLYLNDYQFDEITPKMMIAGSNTQIIHIGEEKGLSFDNLFEVSIQFHHKEISEWLLSNYKCEIVSLEKCIDYNNYRALLFTLLNNEIEITPKIINNICKKEFTCPGLLKYLLERYNILNLINNQEANPLFPLCSNKFNKESIKLLIESGVDVTHKRSPAFSLNPYSPFSLYCRYSDIDNEILQLFINKGGHLNNDDNSIHCITPLEALCQNSQFQLDSLKLLINSGADPDIFYNPIELLCSEKPINYDAIKYLIENGANIDNSLENIVYLLCKESHINYDLIKYLIDMGIDLNRGDIPPLFYICQKDDLDVNLISLLVENGADPSKTSNDFRAESPITLVLSKPNLNMNVIKILISKCRNINNELKLCKKIPNNLDLLKLLISSGVDPNNKTFLDKLLISKDITIDAIQLLLDYNAEPSNIYKEFLSVCKLPSNGSNFSDILKLLVEKGADANICFFDLLNKMKSKQEVNLELVEYLIDHGADVNQISYNESLLYYLCQWEEPNIPLIELFILKNADINKGYQQNGITTITTLFSLLQMNTINIELISLFIKNGALLEKGYQSLHGITLQTPLTECCRINDIECIKLLVNNGADVNNGERNYKGEIVRTPLFILCSRKKVNIEAIKFFLDNGAIIDEKTITLLRNKKNPILLSLLNLE